MDDRDDRNDAIVRALREDPLPDRTYWPGGFAERLHDGVIRGVPRPTTPSRRRRAGGSVVRAVATLSIVIVLLAGLVLFLAGSPIGAPGSSPSPSPSVSPSPPAPLGPTLRIGVSLPLSSLPSDPANAIRDGALLAIADANAHHAIPGITLEPLVLDHATPGNDDLAKAIDDMRSLVAGPTVVGVVGPFNSYVAQGQIPIGNAAGLLQCSPSASAPNLTKGPLGEQLRVAHPDLIAFLRLSPTDDDVAPGLADFAFNDLHVRRAFVVDDGANYGIPLADAFAARFQTDGGAVVGRQTTPSGTTDYSAVLRIGAALHPDVVMFGGVNAFNGDPASGAGAFRKQMAAAGLGALPLIGGDGLKDLDAAGSSLIDIAGPAAIGTYSADLVPADYPGEAGFEAEFRAAYGRVPEPYAGPGYACAQVVIQAIETAFQTGQLSRARVRLAGAEASTTFDTILGALRFDVAGDLTAAGISVDAVDITANGDKGGWVTSRGVSPSP